MKNNFILLITTLSLSIMTLTAQAAEPLAFQGVWANTCKR